MPLLALGLMCSARSAEAYTVQTDSLTTDSVAVQLPADSVEAPKHFYEKGFIGKVYDYFRNSNRPAPDNKFDISFIGGPHYSS